MQEQRMFQVREIKREKKKRTPFQPLDSTSDNIKYSYAKISPSVLFHTKLRAMKMVIASAISSHPARSNCPCKFYFTLCLRDLLVS